MTTKKGQGLSLNTIIIAIIVLIVLVVLVMIFTGYFGKIFTPAVKSCATQGGACVAKCNEGSYGSSVAGGDDCPTGTTCCAKVKDIGFGVDIKDSDKSCTGEPGQNCYSPTITKDPADTSVECAADPTKCKTITSDCPAGKSKVTATECGSGKSCCK